MSTFVATLERKTDIDYTQHMTGLPEVKYPVATNRPDVSATTNYSVSPKLSTLLQQTDRMFPLPRTILSTSRHVFDLWKKVTTLITSSAFVADGRSCCVKQQI